MPHVVQGLTITLQGQYVDADGNAADPVDPQVDIINPSGVTVVSNATPTAEGPTGLFSYEYATAEDAPMGVWSAVWTGLVDGQPASAVTEFSVIPAPGSSGPCGAWPAILTCPTGSYSPTGDGGVADAVQVATDILWMLSGQQFGVCQVSVRPCRTDLYVGPLPYSTGPEPLFDGSRWLNVCGHTPGACGCTEVPEVSLSPAPVVAILEVLIDGEVLDASSYRVDNGHLLVRTDGERWPACQDLAADVDEENTWQVTYTYGLTVPTAGQYAVGDYACELLKGWNGEECALPQRVTDITRQGVSMTVLDSQDFLDNFLTGLASVDRWLRAVNPHGLMRRPAIYSPDRPPPRRSA